MLASVKSRDRRFPSERRLTDWASTWNSLLRAVDTISRLLS